MKKIKYRNNQNSYNNQVYSINYKFDSISPAGKFSGTALDLIKRYNELAKEAHGNGNYVEAEVFRQYAEHYRKIVTEINERKNNRFGNKDENIAITGANTESSANQEVSADVESSENRSSESSETTFVETKAKAPQKSFTVIEVTEESQKSKKAYRKPKKNPTEETAATA